MTDSPRSSKVVAVPTTTQQLEICVVVEPTPQTQSAGHHGLSFYLRNKPTVLQACHALVSKKQTVCVFLDDAKRVGGVITAADIVRNVLAQGLNPARILCSSVMQKDLITIVEGSERGTIELRAVEVMLKCQLDFLAITDPSGRFLRIIELTEMLQSPAKKSGSARVSHFKKVSNRIQNQLKSIRSKVDLPRLRARMMSDQHVSTFNEVTSLDTIAKHMQATSERIVIIEHGADCANRQFCSLDSLAMVKAITLGFELRQALAGETIELLELPSVQVTVMNQTVSARDALIMMRDLQQHILLLRQEKNNGSLTMVTQLEATRRVLQRMQASRLLRRDLLRHVSFRPHPTSPHLIRMPSGKIIALPLPLDAKRPLPSARSHKQLEKVDECFAAGDFTGALLNLNEYLHRNPLDSAQYLRRGLLQQNQFQNHEEAIQDFREALVTTHLSPRERQEALTLLSIGCLELRKFDEANLTWTRFALASNEIVSRNILKYVLGTIEHDRLEAVGLMESHRAYEDALKIAEEGLTMCRFARQKWSDVKLAEKEAEILLVKAKCQQRIGQLDEGLLQCRRAVDLDQTSRDGLTLMTEIERACELQGQVAALTRQLAIVDDPTILRTRANLLLSQGCYLNSFNDFRRAVRLDSKCLTPADEASIVQVMRESEEMQDLVNALVESNNFDTLDRIIALSSHNENLSSAIQRYLEEIVFTHRKAGMDAFSSLQFRPATEHFTLALSICERFPVVKDNLKEECSHLYVTRAACFMSFRETAEALADCDAAITLNRLNEKAWLRRCTCLQAMGDNEGFAKTAREAKQFFGVSNPEIAELDARAASTIPAEACESAAVTSDTVFAC